MTLCEEVNVAESLQRLRMHCFTVAGWENNNDIKLDLLYVKNSHLCKSEQCETCFFRFFQLGACLHLLLIK